MIRGQKKPLDNSSKINVDINTSIHNRFDIEVIDSRTGKVRQRAQAENIILDRLWERFLNVDELYYSWNNGIALGTGNTVPLISDTGLTNAVAFSTYAVTAVADSHTLDDCGILKYDLNAGWASFTRKTVFDETIAVGESLSEIGIGVDIQHIYTKALLKDMNGNPLIINKTNTDVINAYSTVFVHWPIGNGLTFIEESISSRASIFKWLFGMSIATLEHSYNATIPNIVGAKKDGTQSIRDCKTISHTCSIPNKNISFTMLRMGVSDNNFLGGIDTLYLATQYKPNYSESYYYNQLKLSTGDNTWYPGSTLTGEAVGTGDGNTVDFTTKFRIHKDCAIKVNGTSVNNASIDVDKDIADGSYNVHFDTPPAEGDVITADYFTDVIAKDENHVFDFSITFHFGEKVS